MKDIMEDSRHASEVARGQRFEFGKNWTRFLGTLNEERVQRAVGSLQSMLDVESLQGKTFLDIGSGSGLFSLAARKLGAKVYSFDYDPHSVACTRELKRRYFDNDPDWHVQQGSVLDKSFVKSLGAFDVVYSWGVLHHTGDMWSALDNVETAVAPGGWLFLSLYNDQGSPSKHWHLAKKIYNRLPAPLRPIYAVLALLPRELHIFLNLLIRFKPHIYVLGIVNYRNDRGMSWVHDQIDWIGGFPFEVAKPEAIFYFYRDRGFELLRLKTNAGDLGCNEYVFKRRVEPIRC